MRAHPAARKGESTRAAILDHAVKLASQIGLSGISIGRLAEDLGLSKSGLFAHFQSKEALQVQVLETASERFVSEVVRPALANPRGEPRVRALFERWLDWTKSQKTPGGCLFVAASVELDDQPGPARDKLVQLQRDWLSLMANVVQAGVAEKAFRADTDPEQFAHDLYAIMLGYHHASRLLKDPRADARAHAAFERLLGACRRVRKSA
ncbi:MAG TPA: TetR/AcrR family transcriptional regulator [Thermoanaerobaculia bacterium]